MNLSDRDAELRLLKRRYAESTKGRGAVVVADGPVGCGKTALIRPFADWVTQQGGYFLPLTASAGERLDRLGLVDQLIDAIRAIGMIGEQFPPGGGTAPAPAVPGGDDSRALLTLMQCIHRAVTGVARRRPLVISVDDAHFADEASLRCLRYLIRRIDSAAVLIVLTEASCHERALADFHAEILHLPHAHRMRLGPLTPDGVAGQLALHPGIGSAARENAETWARTSGGNPLLLHALIEDVTERGTRPGAPGTGGRTPEPHAAGAPVPGSSFRRAVLRCLHRCEPALLAVARAIAVLGESATPSLIAGLLGDHATSVRRSLADLRAAGLLEDLRFRHEHVRPAVLGDIPAQQLGALRARAAELLLESGAAAAAVADQLLAAGDPAGAPWQPGILIEAAREALNAGDITACVEYLRHASGICADAVQEAEVTAALAEAQWLIDPAKASRYLPQLSRMVRAGLLTGPEALVPVRQLIWRGEFGRADALLRTVERQAAASGADVWDGTGRPSSTVRPDLALVRLGLSFCCPGLRPGMTPPGPVTPSGAVTSLGSVTPSGAAAPLGPVGPPGAAAPFGVTPPPGSLTPPGTAPATWAAPADPATSATPDTFTGGTTPPRPAAGPAPLPPPGAEPPEPAPLSPRTFLALSAGLTGDDGDRLADRVLGAARADTSVASVLAALVLLAHTYRLEEAGDWAEKLLREPWNRGVPMRRALLETARAALALRRGDAATASEAARTALSLATPEAWGIAIGLPLSLAVRAATELGDLETARSYLDLPVPVAMFGTPFTLPYLQAFGRYQLAIARPRAALRNFESCGELMVKWKLDAPEFVDWRNDVTAALLTLGDPHKARAMTVEHLARLGEGPGHARGVALRHLAAVSPPRDRLPLLREAVRILRACGDRLETGRALEELEAARTAVVRRDLPPELPRPVASLWTYLDAARDTPHVPAAPARRSRGGHPGRRSAPDEALAPPTGLTEAERRVAALAAAGCTNREIADRLFITVSTVEQHLTKIYRKLNVRSRGELPASLARLGEASCSPNGR
ncbi:AAA family ATPase [Streptomyces sp. NPDC000134]|uniref:helix-turn-helix transcriptional regulator n=1 Tax=Streptomyces sp. NPDC000134 TaxID=3364536 RepID=UPI0036D1B081